MYKPAWAAPNMRIDMHRHLLGERKSEREREREKDKEREREREMPAGETKIPPELFGHNSALRARIYTKLLEACSEEIPAPVSEGSGWKINQETGKQMETYLQSRA